jgi:hypothetical protein
VPADGPVSWTTREDAAEAAAKGFFAGVDPLLATLLGREPRTVRDVLSELPTH